MILTKIDIYKNFIRESIINLIFAIILLSESFIFCKIVKELDYKFDY